MENKKKLSPKKLIIAIVAIVLAATIIIVSICLLAKKSDDDFVRLSMVETTVRSDTFSMISDGGYTKEYPKNTKSSIVASSDVGYYDIFFDVQITKDLMWVVFSEEELDDTTDLKGKISDLTYYEILEGSLDFDYPDDYSKKLKILTLDEVLELCKNHGFKPYINIMSDEIDELSSILSSLKKYGLEESSAIVSANTKQLLEIQKLSETQECWLIMEKITDENIGIIKANPSVGAFFDAGNKRNNKKIITDLCKTGATIGCYTVNDIDRFEELYSYGVTEFITERILLK